MSDMIERVADALADAEVGYSMTLVRLVDGVSTYSLRYDDGETLEFGSSHECYDHINAKKRSAQARAAIEAMREPGIAIRKITTFEFAEVEWPKLIDAALSQSPHSLPSEDR